MNNKELFESWGKAIVGRFVKGLRESHRMPKAVGAIR